MTMNNLNTALYSIAVVIPILLLSFFYFRHIIKDSSEAKLTSGERWGGKKNKKEDANNYTFRKYTFQQGLAFGYLFISKLVIAVTFFVLLIIGAIYYEDLVIQQFVWKSMALLGGEGILSFGAFRMYKFASERVDKYNL